MKYFVLLSCFAFLLLTSFVPFGPAPNPGPTLTVTGGLISGTVNPTGDVQIFRGIPFAAPPVGNLRWQPPQPVKPWSGVRSCATFGPSPMQGSPAPFGPWSAEFLIPKAPISEDCLYLNVWTSGRAKRSGTKPLPVLVWIYGGGFTSGGSGCAIYDGEATARKGVVFVSVNYRVGPFGFFAHPELTRESGRNASGNYGLMDQVAALQWVKQNIAAFGGDPTNVTVAGQSAGSMSVNCLVATPLASGLFQKAIGESGAGFLSQYPTLQQAEENGLKIMQALGASSLADLRAKPAEEVMRQAKGARGPIIDGYVLPASITAIFAAGKQNPVTLLTGWNEDEGMPFGPPKKAADFQKQLEQQFGASAETIGRHYPASTDDEAAGSQLRLSRDLTFGVRNFIWANSQLKQGKPVYVYRFTRKIPATGDYARYGAFHTGEVAYAYDNLQFIDRQLRPLEAADTELARIMAAYWVNFVKTGNPNGKGLPPWPAYSATSKQLMRLDTEVRAQTMPDEAALDALATVLAAPAPNPK